MTAIDFKFTDSQTKPSQKIGYCKVHKKNFYNHRSYHGGGDLLKMVDLGYI